MTPIASRETAERLRALIDERLASLVAIRHDLHAHPELGYEERRTSGVVAAELERLGIAHKTGMAGGTGIIAHLPATGGGGARSVALRADMDALPILENTGKPYASTNPGVMHACGHDGHTTMLLGAAGVLAALDVRPNPVTLIFQPAEEGGAGGARMCDDGALLGEGAGGLGPPVERAYALHGWPSLEIGKVGTRPGPLLASTDELDVVIRGRQSHAAYPHQGADPIVALSHIVAALQTVASRNVAPVDSVAVTIGKISAGTARNVIPAEARLIGTLRTIRPETRELVRTRVVEIIEKTASALGCHTEVTLHDGYPVTRNDPRETERLLGVVADAFGDQAGLTLEHPSMGGEDFSFYGQHVPACFAFIGVRPRGVTQWPQLHQPEYDFNDDAIPMGVEILCRLALS
ncbi:MAG: amidohydrolase [Phycisphaerales bacterium]